MTTNRSLGEPVHPTPTRRFVLPAVLTLLFLTALVPTAARHEFWRDEMQAWLIARDLPTLPALLEQSHYEGAPVLWSLLLRPLALLTTRPEAMQVLTGALAAITVLLFAAFAPFSRLQKTLLTLNYYFLFEYGIVCRNYLPGILALTIACLCYPRAAERPWPFTAAIVVAAWASVHSWIVAVAVGAAFWGGNLLHAVTTGAFSKGERVRLHLLPLLAVGVGLAGAVYSMLPRADTNYGPAMRWNLHWDLVRLGKVACAFVTSHFPSPRPPGYFWIPPWDTPFPSFDQTWALVLAVVLFSGATWYFRRHPAALLCYLTGTLGIGAFLYLRYLGFSRHTGFLFLTFFFAYWLKRANEMPATNAASTRWSNAAASLVFTAMLAMQAVTGWWAIREDFHRPFSAGKAAAAALTERGLDRAFIAVAPDWAGAPLAGYLNRELYYPQRREYGTFVRWDNRREEGIKDDEVLARALAEAGDRELVIAMDHPFDEAFRSSQGIEYLGHIGGSLTPFEDYFLHYVPARKPNAPQ